MRTGERRSCYYCSETYTPTIQWQLFCGKKCKERWNRENLDTCFYCGDVATDRDHILPVAVRGGPRLFGGQETVRSCGECNSLLGPNNFRTVMERYDYLIQKYTSRYGLNKPMVKWDFEELEEIGANLRTSILAAQQKQEKGEHKVLWLRVKRLDLAALLEASEEEF